MSARKDSLRRRREWLVSQAAAQRSEISCIALHLQRKLRWVDTGFAVGQALRAHPLLAVAGATLLMRAAKTRRLLRAGQLFTAWELFSVVRKQWSRHRI